LSLIKGKDLPSKALHPLTQFIQLIDEIETEILNAPIDVQVGSTVTRSGLQDYYQKEKGERGQARIENLGELVNAARQFNADFDAQETQLPLLASFLSHAALESGNNEGGENVDEVQLMTLHSAKGLEFPLVFLCGLEEGLFPHQRSMEDQEDLEEERRLCYVGITRAQRQLVVTYAQSRRIQGRESQSLASRFLSEIPPELLVDVRPRAFVARPYSPEVALQSEDSGQGAFRVGLRVAHPKFGEGVILSHEGRGDHARVQVNFRQHGSKWLVLSYANLRVM
jgi:DNA helicase-2/ATP-dependent DNA helicase PcrA